MKDLQNLHHWLMQFIKSPGTYLKLSKIKIFYQILVIIAVLVMFLGIQGYQSVSIIDNMLRSTQDVFDRGSRSIDEISNLTILIEQIRSNYLEGLRGESLLELRTAIEKAGSTIYNLQPIDPEAAKLITGKFGEIQDLSYLPASEEHYTQLLSSLQVIKKELQELHNRVWNTNVNLMLENNKFSVQSKRITFVILILSVTIAIFLGFFVAISISKPLKTMVRTAKSLGEGELSQNVSIIGSPEIKGMAEGLNQAIVGLRKLVQVIDEQSQILLKASQELKQASAETGLSASQVAVTMEELAKASTEQTRQIDEAVNTIHILSGLVKKVSHDTETMANTSKKLAESAKNGQKVTGDVTETISEMYHSAQEVAVIIDGLNQSSEQISEVTSMIEGIAEQTTLLALNASIEAARAGDHGKGFGVVARETGKLAEQSKQASRMVADLINQMRTDTNRAVEAMQKGFLKAEAGKNLAFRATTTFEEMFQILLENLEQIQTVANSTVLMAKSNDDAINAISMIAAISQENMASTEEVSATAEEQSASVQQVTALADSLSKIAVDLRETISVFKT